MIRRSNISVPPSLGAHPIEPWGERARIAVELIASLEESFHPEMDRDDIARRIIGHAKDALGVGPAPPSCDQLGCDPSRPRRLDRPEAHDVYGILRAVVEDAWTSRDDHASAEGFVETVREALREMPEVSRYKTLMFRDSSNPLEPPTVQIWKIRETPGDAEKPDLVA